MHATPRFQQLGDRWDPQSEHKTLHARLQEQTAKRDRSTNKQTLMLQKKESAEAKLREVGTVSVDVGKLMKLARTAVRGCKARHVASPPALPLSRLTWANCPCRGGARG